MNIKGELGIHNLVDENGKEYKVMYRFDKTSQADLWYEQVFQTNGGAPLTPADADGVNIIKIGQYYFKKPPASGGVNGGEASTGSFSSTLSFSNVFGHFMDRFTQSAAIPFTVSSTGNKAGASVQADIVTDGISPVKFSPATKFEFKYGLSGGTVDANGDYVITLPAGTYEFYFMHKANGKVTVSVPGNISSSESTLPAVSAPTNFTSTPDSSTQITLSWTDSANDNGYSLQYSTDGGSTYQVLANLATNTISYIHSGLTASKAYYYRLKAKGDGINTSDSAYVLSNATTLAAATTNIYWSDTYATFVSITGSDIQKTAGAAGVWDAGDVSRRLVSGENALIFTAGALKHTIIGFQSGTPVIDTTMAAGIYLLTAGTVSKWGGAATGTDGTYAVGDKLKLVREAAAFKSFISKDGGATWTLLHTWSTAPTGNYHVKVIMRDTGALVQAARFETLNNLVDSTWT